MSEENHEPIDEQQTEQQESSQEPAVEWYIQVAEGKKAGPISFDRLKSFAEKGKIQPATNVRSTNSDAAWLPARDVPDLYPKAEPNGDAATENLEPIDGSPADEEDEVPVEEPSTEVAVSDDSRAVKTPRIAINAGPKKDDKKPEKTTEKKKAAFVIVTGAAAKKKAEEPAPEKSAAVVDASPPEEKVPKEKTDEGIADGSTVTSSPGIKISIGGATGKKEAKKDTKEKSSAGFKFKIDPTGSKPKEEPIAAVPVVEEPVTAASAPKKKEDQSSPGVKISIGAPVGKKKSDDKSSSGKSSEKSASAFKLTVQPKPDKDVKKKSDDSSVAAVESKPKKGDDEDDSTDFERKKPRSGAFLKIVAVLAVIALAIPAKNE